MDKRYVLGQLSSRYRTLPAMFTVVADLEIVEWITEQDCIAALYETPRTDTYLFEIDPRCDEQDEFMRIAQELYVRFPANSVQSS